jgi:RNA polymerase sigma factor (TIGR02999 family)
MQQEKNATLSATSLVHEAYLRLTREEQSGLWANKGHYFAAAAETMRRILIDRARARLCEKRGGDLDRTDLSFSQIAAPEKDERLLAVSEALESLEQSDPGSATLAKLRYFAGMSWEEISVALDVPERTLRRQWSYARAWLRTKIETD